MSNFTDVQNMNLVFGNPAGDPFNPDWEAGGQIDTYVKLIEEELDEIKEAYEQRDFKKLMDGILDTLVVTYGLAHVAGIDADEGMKRVYTSNMSKICWSDTDAKETQQHYWDVHGVRTVVIPVDVNGVTGLVVKVAEDHTDKKGKFFPKGKFLKSVSGFMEPKIDSSIFLSQAK